MRKGLFLSALLASVFVTGAAMADRDTDDQQQDKRVSRGQDIKQQVLEKQREAKTKATKEQVARARSNKAVESKLARSRPHGDVYGDQATRGAKSTATTASGVNMSATGSVNTPREIKAMLSRINPMYGAYRTSQAAEGTDSYGGGQENKAKTTSGQQRNLSATGSVNTPAEIRQMLMLINPMHGAYRTSQAAEGTDSYGGSEPFATGSSRASTSTADNVKRAAQKHEKLRENINSIVKAKMEKAR
jgi:hypothetical protein